jgi:hypothetical protein
MVRIGPKGKSHLMRVAFGASVPQIDWVQFLLGAAALWLPGLALTWALSTRLDWAKSLFVSVIVAATAVPALLYAASLFLGVKLTATNAVLAAFLVATLAVATRTGSALARAWD